MSDREVAHPMLYDTRHVRFSEGSRNQMGMPPTMCPHRLSFEPKEALHHILYRRLHQLQRGGCGQWHLILCPLEENSLPTLTKTACKFGLNTSHHSAKLFCCKA